MSSAYCTLIQKSDFVIGGRTPHTFSYLIEKHCLLNSSSLSSDSDIGVLKSVYKERDALESMLGGLIMRTK